MTKPFQGLLITENRLIDVLEEYFSKYNFIVINIAKDNKQGIDLHLNKNGINLYIEAKGSVRNQYDQDNSISPMPRRSVRDNVRKQITKLMEREEAFRNTNEDLFIAAWPETPTYRAQVNRKANALSRLGYLHIWVQEDLTIKIEGPTNEIERLNSLCEEAVQ